MNILYFGALLALVCVVVYLVKNRSRADTRGKQATPDQAEDPPVPGPDNAQLGIRAFMRGEYESAFELLEPAAHAGNLRAQQLLAKMYYAGNGVAADREQYLYWLRQAAANGDKPSKAKVKKIESGKMPAGESSSGIPG